MNADASATPAVQSMLRQDKALKWFGMRLEEVRPGYARLSMSVTGNMLNCHELCHGGMIFTLAEGVEQARAGRAGVYDMRVTKQGGELIALFRGKSALLRDKRAE